MIVTRLDYKTARFDLLYHFAPRSPEVGLGRDVYMAWFHSLDVPRPVCTVVLWGNYVEWIYVDEAYRRQGVACEVLAAIHSRDGALNAYPVTEAGTALFTKLQAQGVFNGTS